MLHARIAPSPDPRGRPRLVELTDGELERYLDHVNHEVFRLADQLRRDRAALDGAGGHEQPLGKLRPRITRTRAKWKEYQEKQSAAQMEAAARRLFKGLD